jgi:hypothetical protein
MMKVWVVVIDIDVRIFAHEENARKLFNSYEEDSDVTIHECVVEDL